MDADMAERQIDRMVEFIKQEAREKAEELRIKADAEFNMEKLRLIEEAKATLRKEFADNAKRVEVQRKIERSQQIGEARVATMRERERVLSELKSRTLERLSTETSQHKEYGTLLKLLIVRGLVMLREKAVAVRCLASDATTVKGLLSQTSHLYEQVMREGGVDFPPLKLTLDPTPLSADTAGGVVLLAREGKIRCDNTLRARLDIAFESLKPAVRQLLFPHIDDANTERKKTEAARVKAAQEAAGH
ncbi:MAG: hypothetical protein MHM6MM_006120 [Cercozoa sp. M6MM]